MAHVDRDQTKRAINALIRAEKNRIKSLEKRKRDREAQHLPVDDLVRDIENEEQKIIGKETIVEIVDGFGQGGSIDDEIKAERSLLKDGKKELSDLRGQAPKPQKKIDELARNIEKLEKRIAGKEEAKDSVVFE